MICAEVAGTNFRLLQEAHAQDINIHIPGALTLHLNLGTPASAGQNYTQFN
jgi:hypothetical protein